MSDEIKINTDSESIPQVRGCVDGIASGIIFGWIASDDTKYKPELAVLLNGNYIGNITADILRADVGEHCFGFKYDLSSYESLDGAKLEVRDLKTDTLLTGCPMLLNRDYVFGIFNGFSGIEGFGWAVSSLDAGIPLLEVIVDGIVRDTRISWESRPDFKRLGLPWRQIGFRLRLPEDALDSNEHEILIRNKKNQQPIYGWNRKYRFKLNRYADVISRHAFAGWIQLKEYPGKIPLDLYVNDQLVSSTKAEFPRSDVEKIYGAGCGGFHFNIPDRIKKQSNQFYLQCRIGGTNIPLFDTDFLIMPKWRLIQEVEQIIASLKSQDNPNYNIMTNILRSFIGEARKQDAAIFKSSGEDVAIPIPIPIHNNIVDVIVPAYKGKRETIDCIMSVISAKVSVPYELVVINDESPEPELTEELRKLSEKHGFTLLENETNLGFVSTVNRGMKLHRDRDVVLLNSDTIVPSNWIDRLRRSAYSASAIGTVTPLSNRATILSLPKTLYDNDMPEGLTVQDMDDICYSVNKDVVVDIPTAVGFCMYIKRAAINEVGYFDEERFGKGYGEENDFCMRASSYGWRHVAACDIFVQHHGSVSFQGGKDALVNNNLGILNSMYPDYPKRIQDFIRRDPLALYRSRVNIEILIRQAKRYMLFVVHSWGGGTLKAAMDLAMQLSIEGEQVLFFTQKDGKLLLSRFDDDSLICEWPDDTDFDAIAYELSKLNIRHIHFHQTIGFTKRIWDLPEMLKAPYDVTIHDYFFACPRINLVDNREVYCGQPEVAICENCVKYAGLEKHVQSVYRELGESVNRWREFHKERLSRARIIFVPSKDAASRIRRYFDLPNIVVKPHPEPLQTIKIKPPVKTDGILTVAMIGGIGVHKGYKQLLECAGYAHQNNLPIHFVVIGYTADDSAFSEFSNVTITGAYEPEELPSLIKAYNCSAALFLNVWPETFSYTLSEAWQAGLYPIAYDIGAPAERIKEAGVGMVIPFLSNPETILRAVSNNDLLKGIKELRIGNNYPCILTDYYELDSHESDKKIFKIKGK